jgi:histidinol dehydrogenase
LQAEHGPDSQVVLVAVGDEVDITAVEHEVERQCRALPRDTIATKALSHSYIVVVKDMAEVTCFVRTLSHFKLLVVFFMVYGLLYCPLLSNIWY